MPSPANRRRLLARRAQASLAFAAAALLVILGSILLLDRPISALCRRLPETIGTVFLWLSRLADFPVVAAATIVLVVIFLVRGRDRLLLFPPIAGLSAWAVTMLLKLVFARYRPQLLFDEGLYGFGFWKAGHWFNSFPSGHAAAAFGFLVALALARPRWRLPCIAGAALIGVGRVISNAHYLSDVLAGALLGTAAAVLFARLFVTKEE